MCNTFSNADDGWHKDCPLESDKFEVMDLAMDVSTDEIMATAQKDKTLKLLCSLTI